MKPDPDPYWKLRPLPPTPEEEICHCPGTPDILLRGPICSTNPLACLDCSGEFPPERIGFDERLSEAIAFWTWTYQSLEYLWLDSGEYEAWARARLEDPEGEVNRRGLELTARLNGLRRTYYVWFVAHGDDDGPPPANCLRCPRCNGETEPRGNYRVCNGCSIVTDGSSWRHGVTTLMPGREPRAVEVTLDDDELTVLLADGRRIAVPLAWFPRLLHATVAQRNRWRLVGDGQGIHWPDLDEDLSVGGLLLGSAAPGGAPSRVAEGSGDN